MPNPHGNHEHDLEDGISALVEQGYGVGQPGDPAWAEGHPTVHVGEDEVVLDVNGHVSGTVDPKTGHVTWISQD